jgi:hypothetical protein
MLMVRQCIDEKNEEIRMTRSLCRRCLSSFLLANKLLSKIPYTLKNGLHTLQCNLLLLSLLMHSHLFSQQCDFQMGKTPVLKKMCVGVKKIENYEAEK